MISVQEARSLVSELEKLSDEEVSRLIELLYEFWNNMYNMLEEEERMKRIESWDMDNC